jgi:hypothetical protein
MIKNHEPHDVSIGKFDILATYDPQIGEELLIPAGADHSARNIGTTTARWLYGYKR